MGFLFTCTQMPSEYCTWYDGLSPRFNVFLCVISMFSVCLRGFSSGAVAASSSPETVGVNGCLSFCVTLQMKLR